MVSSGDKFLGEDINSQVFTEYLNFVSKFGKTSSTHEQFYQKYHVFASKYDKIQAHNALYAKGGPGAPEFTMAVNQFTDVSDEEFMKGYTGLKVPSRKERKANKNTSKRRLKRYYDHWPTDAEKNGIDNSHYPLQSKPGEADANGTLVVPERMNWFEQGAVTVPYDQGGCGGCWAFSTAAATESLAYIYGDDDVLQEYSVQQLLDCDKQNYGCQGGWMFEGFEYVSKHGIVKKSDYRQFDRTI